MRVSAVPPLDGSGLTVAIALPPSGVRFVLRTLGRSGGPGVPRKGKCRVESSGSTGHQGVTWPGVGAGPSWGCGDPAGLRRPATGQGPLTAPAGGFRRGTWCCRLPPAGTGGASGMRHSSRARATPSVRLAAPSLPQDVAHMLLNVSRVTTNSRAMAWFDRPAASIRRAFSCGGQRPMVPEGRDQARAARRRRHAGAGPVPERDARGCRGRFHPAFPLSGDAMPRAAS